MFSKFILNTVFSTFLLLSAFGQGLSRDLTIIMVGNGSMADKPLSSDKRGWGQMLPMFFDVDVHFSNYSDSGKNAYSFLKDGLWKKVIGQVREGNYVFICFEDKGSTLREKEVYQKTITQFIEDVHMRKGIPVLFVPVTDWAGNDITANAIKEISGKEKVIFIDLRKPIRDLLEKKQHREDMILDVHEAINTAQAAAQYVKDKVPAFKHIEQQGKEKSLPVAPVFAKEKADILSAQLRYEAAFSCDLRQMPATKSGWGNYRKSLKEKLQEFSGLKINHKLPLDIHETGSIQRNGYTIKKIFFQTRPNVYATANLYVPDGKGIFPAIINMHGHWPNGKAGEMVQSCAHELALNGYVCLNIDAWGAGERTTIHGEHEYHGSNLGASLMNIGESLLANQLADNMRGVDLLCSLPFVDKNNIGATGASGGGNQTMWLSAMDERIKAAMPVVSVGTFQSYIMGSNCVCELMPKGLTCTEESGVLALVAPRSIKICSALQDASPTFYPSEMIRSYTNAQPIFSLYEKSDNIGFQLFNTPHGYWPEMRQAMLGWFDLKLKGVGKGDFKEEIPFELLSNEELMVFPKGKRDPLVMSTSQYCIQKGKELSEDLYKESEIDTGTKREELRKLLLLPLNPAKIKEVHEYEKKEEWYHIVLETSNGHLIPLKYTSPSKKDRPIVVVLHNNGTDGFVKGIVDDYIRKGFGVVVADIWGTGEMASLQAKTTDGSLPEFHTLARAELWLGRTIIGEWVSDINNIVQYIRQNLTPSSITIDANKEPALAALFQSAFNNNADIYILRNCFLSYALDRREGIDFFNMAIHLPGILKWGDLSLVAALNKHSQLIFIQPVSVTGNKIDGAELSRYKKMFIKMNLACNSQNKILFKE